MLLLLEDGEGYIFGIVGHVSDFGGNLDFFIDYGLTTIFTIQTWDVN